MSDSQTPTGEGDLPPAGDPDDVPPPPPPPAAPPRAATPPSAPGGTMKTEAERKRMLAQAIQTEVVQGARVESHQDFQAVLISGKPVNHLLHAVIALLTCGVWLLVWLGLGIIGGETRVLIVIDEYGNVLRQKL